MAFDKSRFVANAAAVHMGARDRPLEALLDAIGNEIAALHAEIAELKAATPAPKPRETGWAVVDQDGDPFSKDGFAFAFKREILGRGFWKKVIWFEDKDGANAFARAITKVSINPARAALLYKDTLEEVPGDA